MEEFDLAGALQPIAFAKSGYWTGHVTPAVPVEELTFREDVQPETWSTYAWDADGYPEVTSLYSPWQVLYVDDIAGGASTEVPLETLLLPSCRRHRALGGVAQDLYRNLDNAWRGIDAAWRPLLKVLVALQNEYWPYVSGRVAVVADPRNDVDFIEAGRDAEPVPPGQLLEDLGCTGDQILAVYYFLVERGLAYEPNDGLVMLRRARPRAYHKRWRGHTRRAQDLFDAAELLRVFLVDLTGEPVPLPEATPMDGRQSERAAIYRHGPSAFVKREQLKQELIAADLYPAGVEAIVEGESEEVVLKVVLSELVGPAGLADVKIFNLRGAGAADKVIPLATSISAYAISVPVIVDAEGKMGHYARRAVDLGVLPAEDLCLANASLEEDNASVEELIELAVALAVDPGDGIEPVELGISKGELLDFHQKQIEIAQGDPPGLARSLIKLARSHDPPVQLSKLQLAAALAQKMVAEFTAVSRDATRTAALFERRPVLGFIVKRVIGPINRPVPLS